MAIQKKSLISNQAAAKKAVLAKSTVEPNLGTTKRGVHGITKSSRGMTKSGFARTASGFAKTASGFAKTTSGYSRTKKSFL